MESVTAAAHRLIAELDQDIQQRTSLRDALREHFGEPVLNSRPEGEAAETTPKRRPRKVRSVPDSAPRTRTKKQNRAAEAEGASGTMGEKIIAIVYAASEQIDLDGMESELKKLGVKTTRSSIMQTAAKLAKSGSIARASRGFYQAPGAAKAKAAVPKATPPPASSSSSSTAGDGRHEVVPHLGEYRCFKCKEDRPKRSDYFKFRCTGGA